MKLSAIRIFVRDLAAAKAFYEQTLGLRLTDDASQYGYCSFESGGVNLIVEQIASDAPTNQQALVGRFLGLSFSVEDIADEHRRMLGLGVKFSAPPEKQFWGGLLATFEDPSGNSLQLAQYRT